MPSPILICVAAVVVNLIGAGVAKFFDLPLFLDTGGTIFVAMLSGYVPGLVVGFATNFLMSFTDESNMYYSSISIFVALYTTFLARHRQFQSFWRMLLTIPAMALMTTAATEVIEKFLFCTGVVQAVTEIQSNFASTFLIELADKGLLIVLMFFVIKFVPSQVKNLFVGLGRKQAPLTKEMRHAVYQRKCPRSSLRTKILVFLTLSSFFIAASIASISYRIFEQAALAAHTKIAESLATIAASEVDAEKVDDYLKRGRAVDDYAEVEKNLHAIRDSNSDVKFLFVYKITADGCHVVFDTGEVTEPNTFREFQTLQYPYLDDLIAGKPVPPIVFDYNEGRLLTVYKPIYDAAGVCQCYAVIDFSMDLISAYGRSFIAKVLALFSGCFIFIFAVGLRFVENNIILPVNTMAYCARGFAYSSEKFCEDNVEKIKRLEIHTGDEIENLYGALTKTTQDVLTYFEKFTKMDELAHKDSLTGIKNKAAYDEATVLLDEKISEGDANFCIVMVDVNFLKKINDTYGHEYGNVYLMNAVKLTCAVFGEENVYRIGGDEFVVILTGDKVSLAKYFVTQFKSETERKNFSVALEPWEKVSAAVGVAFYEPDVDKTADEVFKRADALMYEHKLQMKAARSD